MLQLVKSSEYFFQEKRGLKSFIKSVNKVKTVNSLKAPKLDKNWLRIVKKADRSKEVFNLFDKVDILQTLLVTST